MLAAALLPGPDPHAITSEVMLAPSIDHPLGTDELGRDVLVSIVHGIKVSLSVGFAAALGATVIGILVGSTAGFYGGITDLLFMRISEIFQVVPSFILAAVIVALSGPGLLQVVAVISLLAWPQVARQRRYRQLGADAQQRPALPVQCLVAVGVSRRRHLRDRARLQPARRCPRLGAQSAHDERQMSDNILEIADLTLSYTTRGRTVRALDGVSLFVGAGEAVGLVGESGSGKSTLARAALGLTPDKISRIKAGRISIAGRDVTHFSEDDWCGMRGDPVAIVFQDPLSYLNPVMRVGRQIAESISRHAPRLPVGARVQELLELVKLPAACARSYPHELSGGMRQRVLLAIAIACGPKLLIADEPTTALDVTTQAEILSLLQDLRTRLDMAMLLISHDLGIVASACERIYVMYAGRTIEWGSTAAVFETPAHPYTVGLLHAAHADRDSDGRFVTIPGDPPSTALAHAGCPFAPRCLHTMRECTTSMPGPVTLGSGGRQTVRCWLYRANADTEAAP